VNLLFTEVERYVVCVSSFIVNFSPDEGAGYEHGQDMSVSVKPSLPRDYHMYKRYSYTHYKKEKFRGTRGEMNPITAGPLPSQERSSSG
jgi:hypothetical protein